MSDTLVVVENVSKKFCRTLKRSLWYGVKDIGSELFLRSNGHRGLRKEEFWANKDVSLELRRGETLGLIGPNGAGKTTLLRMLNGLIKPDAGRIEVRGRMQALIALGAGFNPILTGRENIYVNSAVLGIPKSEIDRRFDEIVDFSGIEEFIDMPVQSYSSGMAVRLGFAVAVHMDPDVLLVDEVLAVGDLTFQSKCRKRIQELKQSGIAIMLVSHNLYTISYVCTRTVVFEKAQTIYDGDTQKAIDVYRASLNKHNSDDDPRTGTGEIRITHFEILNERETVQHKFNTGDHFKLRIYYRAYEPIQNPVFQVVISGMEGDEVTSIRTDADGLDLGILSGDGYVDLIIDSFSLLPNVYTFHSTIFHADGFAIYDHIAGIAQLKIVGGLQVRGIVYLPHSWHCPQSSLHSEQIIK